MIQETLSADLLDRMAEIARSQLRERGAAPGMFLLVYGRLQIPVGADCADAREADELAAFLRVMTHAYAPQAIGFLGATGGGHEPAHGAARAAGDACLLIETVTPIARVGRRYPIVRAAATGADLGAPDTPAAAVLTGRYARLYPEGRVDPATRARCLETLQEVLGADAVRAIAAHAGCQDAAVH